MRHLDIGHWVDLVRGLAGRRERALMKAHLASGCTKCRRTVEMLRAVAALAAVEGKYEVPAHAVQGAKAIYALNRPEKVYVPRRSLARLVYDSFKEPLPAGVRARHRLTRRALYEAGEYSLDLRLEHQIGTPAVNLVGQIASQENPEKPLADLPVFLVSGKEIIAHTLSNAFGEFQIEYEPRRRLRLYLEACQFGRRGIDVPLNALSAVDASAPNRKTKTRAGKKRRP